MQLSVATTLLKAAVINLGLSRKPSTGAQLTIESQDKEPKVVLITMSPFGIFTQTKISPSRTKKYILTSTRQIMVHKPKKTCLIGTAGMKMMMDSGDSLQPATGLW